MSLELQKCSPFDSDKAIRFIGIDPGSHHLGFSVLEKNLEDNTIALIYSHTIKGSTIEKEYAHIKEYAGARFAKVYGYKMTLMEYFENFEPDHVICESSYMGNFAAAYGALMEMIMTVMMAAVEYRSNLSVTTIDPASVKKYIGAKGNNGDKDVMRQCVKNLEILFYQPVSIDELDEHSIDSIAIGYWGISRALDD